MKHLFTLFFVSVLALAATAQQAPEQKPTGPFMKFEKTSHDFGDISHGDKVTHIFKFTNTGNEPVIITNIAVQCGCTAPKWPRDPVPPGASADIVISFDSTGKSGKQNKVVTIISNASNQNNTLTITTNILAKDTK
ncbi:MAG TPA: DUF1573 domain-containing protein [Cyclobacteriaceae bacterium]|nr:DUF1573 domain-containing protein [Cyclobacteriaceae bacterium]